MRSGQQRRDDAWDQMVSDLKLGWRSNWAVAKAEGEDRQRAIQAGAVPARARYGDLPHLLLTVLTGGLWGPVWLVVWWRNERRVSRIAMGPDGGKRRRHEAAQNLKVEQRAARNAILARRAASEGAPAPVAPSAWLSGDDIEVMSPPMWWALLVVAVLTGFTVVGLVVSIPLAFVLYQRRPWRAPQQPVVRLALDAPTVRMRPVR